MKTIKDMGPDDLLSTIDKCIQELQERGLLMTLEIMGTEHYDMEIKKKK